VWAFENQITREWGTVRPLRKDLRACQSPTLDIYELQIAKEIFLNRVSNRSDKHLFWHFMHITDHIYNSYMRLELTQILDVDFFLD